MTAPDKMPPLPETIWADPGRRNWYFRERQHDSVTSYVRADLHQSALADRDATIARLQAVLEGAGYGDIGGIKAASLEHCRTLGETTAQMTQVIVEQRDRLQVRLDAGEMNYQDLFQRAFDVWKWFEVARPDLIGPRATKLGEAINGPRPYDETANRMEAANAE